MRASVFAILPVFLTLCLVTLPSVASDKAKQEKDLKALQARIGKLQDTIRVKQDSKSAYVKQLKDIEQNIGAISQKIQASRKSIAGKESNLEKLRQSRSSSQQQLSQQNAALAQQVYAAFTLGKHDKLKLLFSQQDIGALQRTLVYYQYFSTAKVELIEKVKTHIGHIRKSETDIIQAKKALEINYQQLTDQEAQLKQDRDKRKNIIASLDKQLNKQGSILNKLQDEAEQLQNLIESIEEILVDAPEPRFDDKPFAKLRGELAWPVNGKVQEMFGRQRQLSDLRWQGIVIEAPAGRPVRAISRGRVAFADWLRGLGNIIIIDHGDSYLSLYGHSEVLFKSAGEWVEAGDIISSIGNSGGRQEPGLYFEIRNKGKPQDPAKWLKNGKYFSASG